jgi:hypothetical protein
MDDVCFFPRSLFQGRTTQYHGIYINQMLFITIKLIRSVAMAFEKCAWCFEDLPMKSPQG